MEGRHSNGTCASISIIAVLSILTLLVFIILGVVNPNPNSVGVHTFEDTMPVIVLGAGALLWLSTLLPFGRSVRATDTASNA